MSKPFTREKSKFITSSAFSTYSAPKLIEAAEDVLTRSEQSEEAFLGAQAVLLINGLI